jgi:hypothetical protein
MAPQLAEALKRLRSVALRRMAAKRRIFVSRERADELASAGSLEQALDALEGGWRGWLASLRYRMVRGSETD